MKEIMQEIVLCGLLGRFFFRKQPFMGERHSEFFMGCTIPESRHMLYERFDTFDFRQEKTGWKLLVDTFQGGNGLFATVNI